MMGESELLIFMYVVAGTLGLTTLVLALISYRQRGQVKAQVEVLVALAEDFRRLSFQGVGASLTGNQRMDMAVQAIVERMAYLQDFLPATVRETISNRVGNDDDTTSESEEAGGDTIIPYPSLPSDGGSAHDPLRAPKRSDSLTLTLNPVKEPRGSKAPMTPTTTRPGSRFNQRSHQGEQLLKTALSGQQADIRGLMTAIAQLRAMNTTLLQFRTAVVEALPEFLLFDNDEETDCLRALSVVSVVFCLVRHTIDGPNILRYGVDEQGRAKVAGQEVNLRDEDVALLQRVFDEAGLSGGTTGAEITNQDELVASLIVLVVLKNALRNNMVYHPRVAPQHAPFLGVQAGGLLYDNQDALAYYLEKAPGTLLSASSLPEKELRLLQAVTGELSLNFGWVVQGEAPPGLMFSSWKEATKRLSPTHFRFYFAVWLAEMGGGDNAKWPWPGAVRFRDLPEDLISTFHQSFEFVLSRLPKMTETEVAEAYLTFRWTHQAGTLPAEPPDFGRIAAMRLVLMVPKLAAACVRAFSSLPQDAQETLATELARTGIAGQHYSGLGGASTTGGPALMIYYAPRFLQQAGTEIGQALLILAELYQAGRALFGLNLDQQGTTATLRVDIIKDIPPNEFRTMARDVTRGFVFRKLSTNVATLEFSDQSVSAGSSVRIGAPVETLSGPSSHGPRSTTSQAGGGSVFSESPQHQHPSSLLVTNRQGSNLPGSPLMSLHPTASGDKRLNFDGDVIYQTSNGRKSASGSVAHVMRSPRSGPPRQQTARKSSTRGALGALTGSLPPGVRLGSVEGSDARNPESALDVPGLPWKPVSVVVYQFRNFHGLFVGRSQSEGGMVGRIHSLYIETVMSETNQMRGLAETFSGDRLVTYFNVSRKDASHRTHAPAAALSVSEAFAAVGTQARACGVRVNLVAGISTGEARVGQLGVSAGLSLGGATNLQGLKALGVLGLPVTAAAGLAVVGKRLLKPPSEMVGANPVLLDDRVQLAACFQFEMRPCARVRLTKLSPQPFTVYQLLRRLEPDPQSCQEWMYELQKRQQDETNAKKEQRALDLFLRGSPEEALSALGAVRKSNATSGGPGERDSTDEQGSRCSSSAPAGVDQWDSSMNQTRDTLARQSNSSLEESGRGTGRSPASTPGPSFTGRLHRHRTTAPQYTWLIRILEHPVASRMGEDYADPLLSELINEV
eukprot:Hpha_TRINITY_DN15331_c3_g1::TRINITY_DN15331_c3_g1_i1::g.89171::m.89171